MSSKQNSPTSPGTNPQTLKIGSRVGCTDDGVEGRIVWANAVAVKIRWDDGEQMTWRRDSLSDRPIKILDAAGDEGLPVAPDVPEQAAAESPGEPIATAPAAQPAEPYPAESSTIAEAVAIEQATSADTQAEQTSPSEPALEAQTPPVQTEGQPQRPPAAAKQP